MKVYMIDVGVSFDEASMDEIHEFIAFAEELGFDCPSSGGGFGIRDMQFETTNRQLADTYVDWAERKLGGPDALSYVGCSVERRGLFWDKVLWPVWQLARLLEKRGHDKLMDQLIHLQHRY